MGRGSIAEKLLLWGLVGASSFSTSLGFQFLARAQKRSEDEKMKSKGIAKHVVSVPLTWQI